MPGGNTAVPLGPGGEFDRIRAIAAALGDTAGRLGDDTATIPTAPGTLVVSTDVSVDGVHFRREWLDAGEIGWRAAAGALSDLAAAGATPAGLVVAISHPPHGDAPDAGDDIVTLMRGVADAARSVHALVLGGDLSAAPVLSLSVTVFGHANRVMSRSGAQPGDGLWVTGTLGGSRAALEAWRMGAVPAPAARVAFARPQPRIGSGLWLAAHGATAMMDVSDGFGGDAPHLAAASGVGLAIDLALLPLHPSVKSIAARAGETAAEFAAIGGEDYELLVTLPPSFAAAAQCEAATGVPLARIGAVTDGVGVRATLAGRDVILRGYRHNI